MVRKITRYSPEVRGRAEELRRGGSSYGQIYKLLKIPKSTLSTWLSAELPGVFDKEKQAQHLRKIRKLALEANKRKREAELSEIKKRVKNEIKTYPLHNLGFLKSVLAALYWAEGGKYDGSPLNFANTDPKLAQLFITLLRKCYKVDEKKLRVRIHLHYYHNIKKSRQFWSKLVGIPVNQFGKVYIKKRSRTKRFRKNFMGICFIKYYDTRIRKEIMELAYQLHEQITWSPHSSVDRA